MGLGIQGLSFMTVKLVARLRRAETGNLTVI